MTSLIRNEVIIMQTDVFESGRLFHGSESSFEQFEHQQSYQHGHNNGFGFYMTPDLNRAKTYAENGYIYEVDTSKVSDMRMLDSEKVTLSNDDLADFIDYVNQQQIEDDGYPYLLSDYGYDLDESEFEYTHEYSQQLADSMLENEYDESDVDIINDLNNALGDSELAGKALTKINIGYSLDHSLDQDNPDVVIFDPGNIKITNKQLTQDLLKNMDITHEISR